MVILPEDCTPVPQVGSAVLILVSSLCFYGFCYSGKAPALLCMGSALLTGWKDDASVCCLLPKLCVPVPLQEISILQSIGLLR